tara:strand:+ start:1978 stop:2235 length:258 start_codon:yes stop_codon:yes gene_type:complete
MAKDDFDKEKELLNLISSTAVLEILAPQIEQIVSKFQEIKSINNESIKVYNDTVATRNAALTALKDEEIEDQYTAVEYKAIPKLK